MDDVGDLGAGGDAPMHAFRGGMLPSSPPYMGRSFKLWHWIGRPDVSRMPYASGPLQATARVPAAGAQARAAQ
jgi:hypothetical protein